MRVTSRNCKLRMLPRGGGTQLCVMRHVPSKRPYIFSLAFTERPPFLPYFTPYFTPYFLKMSTFLTKCWEIFWPFWPWKSLFFDAFRWKTPYFCALCHWKTPFFDAICHRKTPTSEVLGGTRTSFSYVSAPPACSTNSKFTEKAKDKLEKPSKFTL